MPTYNNHFKYPVYEEHEIRGENDDLIGTLRVKPSSILWKAKGKHKFLSVPLDRFAAWIASKDAGATPVTQ